MIKQQDGKWVLCSDGGSWVISEHDTEADALERERKLKTSKLRAAEQAEHFHSLFYATTARNLAYSGEHPFTYCMQTVIPAMEREGKAPDDPEAFCGWWKMEHAQTKTLRELHLRGCAGKATVRTENGVEYIVVPVVALMEGVIHAVNAETPEFVPITTLKEAAESWNGKPVTIGHPVKDGKQCSAQEPAILEAHGIGTIRNSRVEGMKLLMENWIEKQRVKKLHPEMHDRLLDARSEEVSVGAFVIVGGPEGEYQGKRYKRSWLQAQGDHLAYLPGGRGACSIEMGCGAYRAASYVVMEQSLEPIPQGMPVLCLTVLSGNELEYKMQTVTSVVREQTGGTPMILLDDRVIMRRDDETFVVPYTLANGQIVVGDVAKVHRVIAGEQPKYDDCPACKGTGSLNGNPCEACNGTGDLRIAAGARHSTSDRQMIQAIHDQATSLGAQCSRDNYETWRPASQSNNTIRNEGGKWVLYSKDKRFRLGTHNTEAEAIAQQQAIEAATQRREAEKVGV